MSKSESELFDLEDRDPQHINQHIQVSWADFIGEPKLVRSPECAWSLSQYCFRYSRLGVYTCLSVLCAPFAACLVGSCYALFYFQRIWCTMPCLWLCRASCGVTHSFVTACTQGCLIPLMAGFGNVLSQIKVRTETIREEYQRKEEEENKPTIIV